jgi:uncharacterized protein YjbJ (UPF0337 family)
MSTTVSEHTIKGKYDEVAGKVKQAAGEAVGNHKLANEGTAQQVKGHAEQVVGTVKEAYAEHKPERDQAAHDVREKLTSTAQNVKESIQHAVDPKNHPKT